MSRKHFIALAEALKEAQPTPAEFTNNSDTCRAWRTLVKRIAGVCQGASDNFNSSRFYNACAGDNTAARTLLN